MLDAPGRELTSKQIAEYLEAVPFDRIPAAMATLATRLLTSPPPDSLPESRRDRYLSPDQITDQYGLDRRWVYAHAEALGAVKCGHRTMRVPESGLRRYLDDHRVRR